jgi:hypothetical protein
MRLEYRDPYFVLLLDRRQDALTPNQAMMDLGWDMSVPQSTSAGLATALGTEIGTGQSAIG